MRHQAAHGHPEYQEGGGMGRHGSTNWYAATVISYRFLIIGKIFTIYKPCIHTAMVIRSEWKYHTDSCNARTEQVEIFS